MKIVFTTGGSGGHFYPIVAVAEELNALVRERNLVKPDLYYLSNQPYDEGLLYQNDLIYKHVAAGKLRVYFSLENATDFIKTLVGLPQALRLLYSIYPDVVFSKGSYASVPVVMAARILKIPVFLHDSDAVPGRANLWAGKFAERIAVSYPEAAEHFEHEDRVACVGNPVRSDIRIRQTKDAHMHFDLASDVPTILVMGGSQGADHINNTLLRSLKDLLARYQVIHQIGKENFEAFKQIAEVELEDCEHSARYKPMPYLTTLDMRAAAGAADLVVSRSGSGAIFEIANWELPSILIPIPETVSRDQRYNAYAYARSGATEVIEQHNCTPHVLTSEIDRVFTEEGLREKMIEGARTFKRPDAAKVIAQEIMRIAIEHEAS